MCAMIGVMKSKSISVAIILGVILGPTFYFVSPEWCILFGGTIAGTIAFLIGEKNLITQKVKIFKGDIKNLKSLKNFFQKNSKYQKILIG